MGVIEDIFLIIEEYFGEVVIVDLKFGGRDVEVIEDNKKDYVEYVLFIFWLMGLVVDIFY